MSLLVRLDVELLLDVGAVDVNGRSGDGNLFAVGLLELHDAFNLRRLRRCDNAAGGEDERDESCAKEWLETHVRWSPVN